LPSGSATGESPPVAGCVLWIESYFDYSSTTTWLFTGPTLWLSETHWTASPGISAGPRIYEVEPKTVGTAKVGTEAEALTFGTRTAGTESNKISAGNAGEIETSGTKDVYESNKIVAGTEAQASGSGTEAETESETQRTETAETLETGTSETRFGTEEPEIGTEESKTLTETTPEGTERRVVARRASLRDCGSKLAACARITPSRIFRGEAEALYIRFVIVAAPWGYQATGRQRTSWPAIQVDTGKTKRPAIWTKWSQRDLRPER
jgi:hypothetical protein